MKHNWEYKQLGDICSFERGVTYSKDDESDISSEVIILRSNNINLDTFSLNFDDLKYLKDDFQIKPSKRLKANSILICLSNGSLTHLGKTAFIDSDYDMAFGGFMGLIIPNSQNPKYISYIFRSSIYYKFLDNLNRGANIRNLQFSKLSNFLIPIPPMEVQERIVAELDKINEVIEDCRELLRNLDALAQSLFYDYFGDPITNPKGWETSRLGDLCDIVGRIGFRGYTRNDLVNKGEGAITLSPSNIVNGNINYDNCSYISWYKYDESPEIQIFNGDVLLTKTGSTVGKIGCVSNLPEKATINPQLVVLKNLSINNRYLTFLIRDNAYQDIIREKSGGSAVPTISQKILATIAIPVPPLSLQEKFAERIEQIDAQKKAVEETIANLQTLLDSRMDYWFNNA